MLDSTTKKRIDDCRDILVGKLPDPKSQIEQITIALIYKFMDDMDKEAVELGGKPKFFSGDYAKFAWDELFAPQLGSADMLALYAEAIESMEKNGNIPQLFRDIFKNAYLPYRDPGTLKMFLKTIGEFSYGHSEMLGDAFEYLLSIMGSQGDAGQFRTPRHIIDFLVQVVDPKKEDTILDPACGTAGFLISAFKHILKQNKGQLTPDQRKKLMRNVVGYDISPDMQRLALVNLYLHGFNDPHIHEYDTLSSEERWDETYDVILANPPFMTPKGGIRPHKKFGVQSNRSEVLFVDYIAEHLNTKGRAGIIVPEGIIFQSGTAYKDLRKMLVSDHLYAVISLPAGVFNPYSGVKTSILLLDRETAKRTDSILFVKVDNDGYNLGAQRAAVKGGQLDDAVQLVRAFREGTFIDSPMAHTVEKTAIAESGDYNLSGERYRVSQDLTGIQFDIVAIGDVFETGSGGTPLKSSPEYYQNGTIPWLRSGEVSQGYITEAEIHITKEALKNSSAKVFPVNTVLVAMYGATAGQVGILKIEASTNQAICGILPNSKAIPEYIYLIIKSQKDYLISLSGGGAQPNISQKIVKELQIPLPPLLVQEEIVAEIEGYQKIIDGARMVVENYRPQITIDPEWEMVELGEILTVGAAITQDIDKSLIYIGADSIEANTGRLLQAKTAEEQNVNGPVYEFNGKRLMYSKIRPYLNKLTLVDMKGCCSSDMYPLVVDTDRALFEFVADYMISPNFLSSIQGFYERASIPKINRKQLFSVLMPLPPIEVQNSIVKRIENEKFLVNSNKQLISIFERTIKERIDRVWGIIKEHDGG
jgi:type I restriction enzyme M protein